MPDTDPFRAISLAAEATVAETLGRGSAAADFARAVVLQTAHPLGSDAAPPGRESEVLDRVLRLLANPPAGLDLAADPALLAACFQNIDLLYGPPPHPRADQVAVAVLEAAHRDG